MIDLLNDVFNSGTSIVTIGALLWLLVRSLRTDVRLTRRLEHRLRSIEASNRRAYSRIFQLEDVLRGAGISIPPWSNPEPDDDSHLPRLRGTHR